jgi:Transglycosylase SLT domain
VQIFCRNPSVSLCDREWLHSYVQRKIRPFGGRRRPLGRRPSVLSWKEQLTAAGVPPVGMIASLFTIAALGLLSCSLVAIAGKATQKSTTATTSSWASLIAEASQRFRVPAHWIRAVMQAESTGDTAAISPKGAMGLMQVMPETYEKLRFRYHLGTDLHEPRNNILAGVAYLREMHDRFGPDGFLAAYNAGPGRYESYLKSGRPLPEETRIYVATLAPVIGVPGIPYHSAGASTASQFTMSGAANGGGEHPKASSKNEFATAILQFDDRQNARTKTLFAIARAAFESTSASAQMIDMTALEPPPSRALIATTTAAESLRTRTSTGPRSSLAPSGDALFAGLSTHISK